MQHAKLIVGVLPLKAFHDDTFAEGLSPDGNNDPAIQLELKDLLVAVTWEIHFSFPRIHAAGSQALSQPHPSVERWISFFWGHLSSGPSDPAKGLAVS